MSLLDSLKPFDQWERKVIEMNSDNEEKAAMIIKNRRAYLSDNKHYLSSLGKEQYKSKFTPRSEKSTVTMPSYYRNDYINKDDYEEDDIDDYE